MPTTLEVAEALADALVLVSPPGEISVSPFREFGPAGPMIDIYCADPAEEDLVFGAESATMWWVLRIRVPSNDRDGWQEFLYQTRDRTGPTSVRAALLEDITLGGVVDGVMVGRPTDLRLYSDAPISTLDFIGHEWRVGVMVSGGVGT